MVAAKDSVLRAGAEEDGGRGRGQGRAQTPIFSIVYIIRDKKGKPSGNLRQASRTEPASLFAVLAMTREDEQRVEDGHLRLSLSLPPSTSTYFYNLHKARYFAHRGRDVP